MAREPRNQDRPAITLGRWDPYVRHPEDPNSDCAVFVNYNNLAEHTKGPVVGRAARFVRSQMQSDYPEGVQNGRIDEGDVMDGGTCIMTLGDQAAYTAMRYAIGHSMFSKNAHDYYPKVVELLGRPTAAQLLDALDDYVEGELPNEATQERMPPARLYDLQAKARDEFVGHRLTDEFLHNLLLERTRDLSELREQVRVLSENQEFRVFLREHFPDGRIFANMIENERLQRVHEECLRDDVDSPRIFTLQHAMVDAMIEAEANYFDAPHLTLDQHMQHWLDEIGWNAREQAQDEPTEQAAPVQTEFPFMDDEQHNRMDDNPDMALQDVESMGRLQSQNDISRI